jgi:hypothetical protein
MYVNLLPIVLLSRLNIYVDEIIGEHQCGLHCNILHLSDIGAKMGVQWDNTSCIYNFKKPTIHLPDMYTIIGICMKLVRLIKMCLNETFGKVRIGMHLLGVFYYSQWSEQGLIATAFQLCIRLCHLEVRETHERTGTEWDISSWSMLMTIYWTQMEIL